MKTFPDFGAAYPVSTISTDIDNAELGARLVPVRSLRRSGKTLYYDLCQSIALWNVTNIGVLTGSGYWGTSCFQLVGAAGATGSKQVLFPGVSKFGMEIFYNPAAGATNILSVSLDVNFPSTAPASTLQGSWVVDIDPAAPSLTVGSQVHTMHSTGANWHNLKMICERRGSGLYARKLFHNSQSWEQNEFLGTLTVLGFPAIDTLGLSLSLTAGANWLVGGIIITTDEA